MALVVKNAVKKSIKNMRFSGDFFPALDKFLQAKLKEAAERAKKNGRATIRPYDL
ncbi:MAG: DUF1931 domain-containing protein [Candidatus Aenigmarchaeota archaeon]|nr:DUF1931 domain-containing protein [Candidatus Aenigmarchaeota archaeon]